MKRAGYRLAVAALALPLVGCVVIPYHPEAQTRRESTAVPAPEGLLLSVGPRRFLEKLARGVLNENERVRRVDGQTFLDMASPERHLTLAGLLEIATRDRIAPLGVDYVVLFRTPIQNELEARGGGIPLAVLVKQKDFASYWAAVVDVRQMKVLEQITSEATGTSAGAQFFYGLYVQSLTEGSARKNAIRQVAATLASAQPTGAANVAFLAVEPAPAAAATPSDGDLPDEASEPER